MGILFGVSGQKGMSTARGLPYVWILVAFLLAITTRPLQAQTVNLDRPIRFDIKAQGVGAALIEFSRQANIQVLIGPGADTTRVTPLLHMTAPARTALDLLLRNTGLTYKAVGDSISITRADDRAAPFHTSNTDNIDVARSSSDSSIPGDNSLTEAQQQQRLDTVVVTAQKREERVLDVPISISVLSGAALDTSTVQGISDELNRVPGVVIPPVSGFGLTTISIRGVSSSPSFAGASPIAYYLDTVPFGFVRSAFIPDAGAFDLARIEVLRGPQGTLYGANAEDGVVRVITSDADPSGFDFKARAIASYTDGANANKGGDAAVNVPLIENQLAVRGVVSYHDWSGWVDRPTEKNANDAQLRDYRFKLAYKPIDGLSIDLSYWGNRDHSGSLAYSLPNRTCPDCGSIPEPIDTKFDAYGGRIAYQFAAFSITSMTSYLDFSSYNQLDGTAYGGPFFDGLNTPELFKSHVFSEELLLNSADTSPWRWTVGAFYRDAGDVDWQVGYQNGVYIPAVFFDNRDASRSYAFFGQIGRRFLDNKFEWTLGLRQFHDDVSSWSLDPTFPFYQKQSFSATTPRAVLSWFPTANTMVYSSFSEGFRSGMPQYYSVVEFLPLPPVIKPDKLYNYEVGTKTDFFNHHLALDTSVYYVKWRDVQQVIPLPLPGCGCGFSTQVNGVSASGPGVDIALTLRPTARLTIGGTLSVNDMTWDKDTSALGQILFPKGSRTGGSKHTESLFANYTVWSGGGTSGDLSVSGNYTSQQCGRALDFNNIPYSVCGNSLLFAQAAFTVAFPTHWAVKLYGDNLTNEFGSLSAPPVGFAPTENELVPRPRPRTFGLEVDYRYR